jgi:RHS repeat-associated protein
VAVTNSSGTLTSQQRYLPFGGTRAILNSPILATDFGYTGQRLLDSGMGGIMDYKARFYSVYLNRFIQPDSIIPSPANPQSWNRFSYALNNPIRYNDPTGHAVSCEADEDCKEVRRSDKLSAGEAIREALAKYKVKLKGNWNDENSMAVLLGVLAIGNKLVENTPGGSVSAVFGNVYGSVTAEWVNGVCGAQSDRCYADAYQFPSTIRFYSSHWTREHNENGVEFGATFKKGNPAVSAALVVHEFGHAFDSRTGGLFNQDVASGGITNKTGFGTVIGANGQTEVTADLFTNWVLGTFTDEGDLQKFMDDNIATWVNIASTP